MGAEYASKSQYEQKKAENRARNLGLADAGVVFTDIDMAWIDKGASVGKGTKIGPCVTIEGDTTIGENCDIGQNSQIHNSAIGDNVTVISSVIKDSRIGNNASVGPFAYIRPGSTIGEGVRIGDFVEIKNSVIGDGTKVSHLTYVGDADLGRDINVGCGVVFVNYDGRDKYRSTIGDGAFIGCNVNLVSPVNVAANAYVAAGTTVTEDVPEGSLHIGRAKGKNLEGWVERRGLLKGKEK